MEILLDNRQKRIEVETDDLIRKAERILEDLDCSPSTILSISLVRSDEMADLNLKFRGREGPTNVLSFPQPDQEESDSRPYLLGDVVICADRVCDDAKELGYTDREMTLYLLVHGILHLVGYVHDRPEDADRMAERVGQIFNDLTTG